ncbi:MAG TPA: alpha-mannosidase, partial [Armatimonadota bacterium]
MEKHPQITLERIARTVEELQTQLWIDQRPLQVSAYQCAEPIPFEEAVRQAFTPVEPGFCWGPIWSTAWFRIQGAYPDAWAGSTVAALIDTGSEALVWQHGAPAQGLDVNRQDFVLDVQAGGVIDLYVEAAGNQLFGVGHLVGPTPFTLKAASVARLNQPVWDLYYDMRLLFDLAKQLPEDAARRAKLIFALNAAANAYRSGEADACARAREILAVEYAMPAEASMSDVLAAGHSHIDTAWLWPVRETIRKCSRTFSTVLKYMETYPEYRYTQSQPQLYAFVKERYPALYARITQAVAEGRWEPEGGMWVEADCNIISGESMVRQFLYGKKFFREEFGLDNTILWLPDVFGYSAALPQILQGCGIPYFMTQKISWNQLNKFPHHTFWWEGIDGTRVLTHFLPADTYNGNMLPSQLLHGERNFKDKERANSWLYLYGHGDGGGGVTKEMLELARRSENVEGVPRVRPGLARDWFPKMAAEARDLRTWVGELYLELHRGTFTTQAKNKWENRRCEFLLRDAECLAVLQPEGIADYPATELEQAWKLVLLNQFHDIIPGSSIGWVYEDSAQDYAAVHETAEGIIGKGLASFAGHIDTAALTRPLLIWNTLSFVRSGLVSIPWEGSDNVTALAPRGQATRTQFTTADGEPHLLIEVADAPAMGYVTLDLLESDLPEEITPEVTDAVTASGRVLENSLVRVELDDFGAVVSCYDKQQEREIIAPGAVGNRFEVFDDHPNNWDAWDIDPFYDEVAKALPNAATITVTDAGLLRATLRVERELTPQAHLVQEVRLEANSRRIDFVTHIDWHEDHALLKVAFPVDIHSLRATFEIQYGHVERPTHKNTSWDVARFEVPAHKWADLSESDYGVALLNNGKYGYDVQGNVLRLTLLRAPKNPDPQADMGQHHFTYSLLPHRGELTNSGVPMAGYDLNVPLLVQPLPVQEGVLALAHSYFRLDKHNLLIESVKRAEDGDGIIVRLYEAFRRRGTTRLLTNGLCSRATRTDLLERDQEELVVRGGSVLLSFRPFEIITLR